MLSYEVHCICFLEGFLALSVRPFLRSEFQSSLNDYICQRPGISINRVPLYLKPLGIYLKFHNPEFSLTLIIPQSLIFYGIYFCVSRAPFNQYKATVIRVAYMDSVEEDLIMYCFLFLFTPPTFTYELYQSEKCTSLGDFFFWKNFYPVFHHLI